MPKQKTSVSFNRFAKKLVCEVELKSELRKVFEQESGKFGSKLRSLFSMNPEKTIRNVSAAIQHFIIFSNNPEARKLAYLDTKSEPQKIYLDANAVCDIASKMKISPANKNAIFKAVKNSPDHTAKAAAGLLKKF